MDKHRSNQYGNIFIVKPTRALLLESVHPLADDVFSANGIEIERHSGGLDEDELIDALQDVDILGIRSKTQITERVLKNAPKLKAIGAFCIGTNQIDLPAAANAGIAVFNAPFSNTRSVVELTISELIALTRRLTQRDKAMHDGVWDKTAEGAHEVRGRTLGIIGYGNIGSQLSVIAEALGMRVLFYDTAEKLALGNAQRADSLSQLLAEADVVSLHVDGRAGNAGMFGEEQFAQMKQGSIFINPSRGFVVDLESLRAHIESGHIAGAAVDVFPQEPKKRGDAFESVLRGLPNVILTPHVGGSTVEAQENIGQFVATKLRDYLQYGATTLSVNLPNLALQAVPGSHRITHLHRNVPGVMARMNQILAEHGVNINGQLLATEGEVGYAVTDISSGLDDETVTLLRQMDETIFVRILK